MPETQIYVIGTVHEDFDGLKMLETFLHAVKSDIIGVEYTIEKVEKSDNLMKEVMPKHIKEKKLIQGKMRELGNYPKIRGGDVKEGLKNLLKYSTEPDRLIGRITMWLFMDSFLESCDYTLNVSRLYQRKNPQVKLEFIDLPLADSEKQLLERESLSFLDELYRKIFTEKIKYEDLIRDYKDQTKKLYELKREDMRIDEQGEHVDKILKALNARDTHMSSKIRELVEQNREKVHVYLIGNAHRYGICSRISELSPINMNLPEAYERVTRKIHDT